MHKRSCIIVIMNRLDPKTRAQIVRCLVDGNSIRATCRITGAAKNTVVKLLCDLGKACRAYHDHHVRGVTTKRVQCDEIWSYVFCKEKNLSEADQAAGTKGSMWTWTAIDADTKLVVSYMIGQRDVGYAQAFMRDVADRLANRVQLVLVYSQLARERHDDRLGRHASVVLGVAQVRRGNARALGELVQSEPA